MNGAEFVRRVTKLGRKRGIAVVHETRRGKGSHSRLRYGGRLTTVALYPADLRTGTLHAMLKQLGLTLDDSR